MIKEFREKENQLFFYGERKKCEYFNIFSHSVISHGHFMHNAHSMCVDVCRNMCMYMYVYVYLDAVYLDAHSYCM